NDVGQIAGSSCGTVPWNGPYLHKGQLPITSTNMLASSLWISPNIGECIKSAASINAHEDLAISAVSTVNAFHAYLYKNGKVTDVNTRFNSHALTINNHDQLVGQIDADTRRAYLFKSNRALNLNLLTDLSNGLFLRQGIAINDSGQILCTG